jgi:uncharacterized protein YkwD/outer membrane protein OmpA-like peptidoglycan-associated protein
MYKYTCRHFLSKASLLLFSLLCLPGLAQKVIDLNNINTLEIENLFYKKFNDLRTANKLDALAPDKILKQAALDQSQYMAENNYVGHDQKTKGKENPTKRVFFYGGTHEGVGENCTKIYLGKPMKVKYKKEPITVNTYEEAAEALFQSWKNSPGHYKNMIEPKYEVSGLAMFWSKDSSALYAAQVFGQKPWLPKKEFMSPPDAYGVKELLSSVCKCMQTPEGDKAVDNIQFVYGNDSIYVRSEDYKAVKSFFNNPGDAIYVDVVLREQFVCAKNNLLHGSSIFDGTMLKPVLFSDLYKRNQVKDGKNMYSALMAYPKGFDKVQHNINHGFVKNGYACQYVWSRQVPSANLDMLDLYPKWLYQPDTQIEPDSFIGELSFAIPFERNKAVLSEKNKKELEQKLNIYGPFVTGTKIKTFSSVEGSSELNLKLQQQRADEILRIIQTKLKIVPGLDMESRENWDDFFRQIEFSPFAYLKNLPKTEIKNRLKKKPLLDSLDYLLKTTRIASVTIRLKAKIDNDSPPLLLLAAYKRSIERGDSLKAFKLQNKLLDAVINNQLSRRDILPVEIPLSKKMLPLLTNYLALAVADTEMVYTYKARQLVQQAIKVDSTYLPVQFNFCILSLKYLQQFNDTIAPIKTLEKRMMQCFNLSGKSDSALVNHMLLNYHILSVYNHWMRHQYDKLNPHLLSIKKYYPYAQITEYQALRLGLLFNLYARYSWTFDLLLPYMQKKTYNEDIVFLFVQTNALNDNRLKDAEWISYLQRAKSMNEKRFYNWIDKENFQYMRVPEIKKEFCTIHSAY